MEQGFNPHRFAFGLVVALLLAWLATMAALLALGTRYDPPPGRMLVLFSSAQTPEEALSRVIRQDGFMIGGGLAGRLWSVYSEDPDFARRMRGEGVLALWRSEAFDWMFSSGCTGASSALTRAKPRTPQN